MSNTDISQTMKTATVDVKSAWASKVNWIAGSSALLVSLNEVLSEVAPFVPPKYAHWINIALAVVGGLSTIIAKTFYTTTVTPSAVKT